MKNIEQLIENKYNELINKIDENMFFSIFQSAYKKIITNKYRVAILHYAAASILMEETWKLKTNLSKDWFNISVEWVDEIFEVALKYLDDFDDETKRITINNTSSFPNTIAMIYSFTSKDSVLSKNNIKVDIDDRVWCDKKWEYIDKIDLEAEELSQQIEEMIEKWGWKWSIERKIRKYLEKYPYHWRFYELLFDITLDLEVIENWFEILENKFLSECNWKWPKTIMWWYTDNRPLLTFIKTYALILWLWEENKGAEKILKLLLKLNENDNQWNRYDLLAIKEWFAYEEFINKFDKWWHFDNEIFNWFAKNSKKYKEFKNYED